MTRRTLFKGWAGGTFAHALLAGGQQSSAEARKPLDALPGAEKNRRLKVVFVGAHVDDWIFCVGTLARYAAERHEVLCFSFTPGDSQAMADGNHMPLDKLAALRREDSSRDAPGFRSLRESRGGSLGRERRAPSRRRWSRGLAIYMTDQAVDFS